MTARAGSRERDDTGLGSSRFGLLAFAFLPADPERRGVAVEAPPEWSLDRSLLEVDADIVVWGRAPEAPAPLGTAARRAGRRELALRVLGRRLRPGWRVAAVHRLPPRELRPGALRGSVRAAVRGGALAELRSAFAGARVLDAVAKAAGVVLSPQAYHAGTGGALLVLGRFADGSGAVLRLARADGPRDPTAVAETLELLRRSGVAHAPRLHAHGRTAGAAWLAERALSGRRPRRLTDGLIRSVADTCASFPLGEGPPAATAEDLAGVAALLPGRAAALERLAADVAAPLSRLPSILRHGDLWAGNVLVDRGGNLSGLVDWDAAHPAGVPGADLLQLVATDARRSAGLALGPAFLTRPWRLEAFARATSGYWPRIGIRPDEEQLEAVAAAWWAAEVHGTLARLPHRADDEGWVGANVDSALASLGY